MSQAFSEDSVPVPVKPGLIERRQFLALGATALVGLATASLPATVFAAASSPGEGTPLSVGFIDFVQGSGKAMSRSAAISATSVSSPSSFTTGSARLTVRGVWRRSAAQSTPLTLRLIAYYPTDGGPTPLVLSAFESNGGNVAGAVSRTVIPMNDDAIELAIITSNPVPQQFNAPPATLKRVVAGSVSEVLPTRDELVARGVMLSLGTRSVAANKLAWGTYFIAFPDGVSSTTADWKNVHVADLALPATTDVRGSGPLSLASFTGSSPVDFSYVMISVEPQPVESYRHHAR